MINEIPNIATAAIFGAKDLTDKDFAAHQGKYRKDLVDIFSSKVKEQAKAKPFEYGPDVESTGATAALKVHEEQRVKDNYPTDTQAAVEKAITDLALKPELQALHNEIEGIMLELKGGDRVAGRVPVKNERGEITGWKNSGAAYPGGLGAETLPALRNYLEGKPLTPNQETQLAKATRYAMEKLSAEAGFDVANQTHVANEDMAVGDQLTMDGEKFTVKELDPDTGNITLKDGKLVTLKAGETVLADRGSHLDADGNPAGQRQTDTETSPFDPDAFLAGDDQAATPEPVRQQIGDLSAEKTPEGHWEIVSEDGNRSRLDPTVAEDHALIQMIDPDARAAEVKRIATETAATLPGARIHFIDDEAAMNKVRTNLGEAVKEIRAEDGTVKGFAVVGTGDYFIMSRNMRPDEAAATVVHEAVGHVGVQGVLGDRIDTVMDGVFSSKGEQNSTIQKIAKDYGLDLTTQAGRREAAEELIAHVAERRDKDPGAWKRLVAKIKDTFRQMGYEWAQEWTDNDILVLIQRGKERVSRPEQARSKMDTTSVRMSKQGSSDLTKADQDMLNKRLKERLYGRPDLSQVTTSKQTRGLVADVDQARNEAGDPTPQTFKTWKTEADTRMQADTTGEWLNFLSGKLHYEGDDAGQNVMVARKLLENKGLEAFASGDDAEIAKVGAAIWGYRNTRSNLARALAAGRDFQETPAERNRRWISEALYYPGAKVDSKLKGMDLKSMQAELQKRAGKMQEVRTKLLDMGIDLAKLDEKTLNDPAAMAEIVRQIQISNAGYGDMAYEYWRNAILSAPPTHAANILGNTLSTTWNYTAQKSTEALINAVIGNKAGTTFKELPGMYRAMWGAKQQAARNAVTAFSTEQGSIEGIRLDDKGVAIPGKAGRIIRTPQRALLSADEFSKSIIIQAEMYSRAYQEAYAKGWRGEGLDKRISQILSDPKSDMMSAAIDEAKYLTFQAEPGEITSWLMKSRSTPGLEWVSKYILPFVSTPTNIVKMGIRKTPLGILRMAKEAAQGNYKGNRNALVRDSAEQMLAIAGVFSMISLINDEDEDGNPRITGSGPSGGKGAGKQQAEQRQHPAQSIRLGGRWYSYSRIEPLATAITHTVDIIQAIKNKPGEDSADQLGRVWSSMKSLARDKTFLSTIGDIIRATEDDSKGISIVQNFASSWIPNIVRSGMRATDPMYRSGKLMTRDDRSVAGELASNIGQAALPVAALQDAPRMDFWGRPMAKSEGFGQATDVIWRLVSPITVQHAHAPDNFDRMLFNYNRKAEQKGWEKFWPAMPGNSFELPGARGIEKTARMNPDEYSRFLKRRGDFFFTLAAGTQWKFDDPSTMEVSQFKKFMSKATLMAKNDIIQERKLNPVLKALKQNKEDQRPRPQLKPIPQTRPMMNLDSDRRSL
jgi:hypothetical protein